MRIKFIWLALSFLMVVAMVLASCQAAPEAETEEKTVTGKVTEQAPAEEEKENEKALAEKEVTPAGPEMVTDVLGRLVQKPQYGGTITLRVTSTVIENIDPVTGNNVSPIKPFQYNRLMCADWLRGPQGTGEDPFTTTYHPREFTTGELVESYEYIDPTKIIYHLRQDVYWQDVPPVNGRQFTADDVIATVLRMNTDPRHYHYKSEQSIVDWVEKMEEEEPERLAAWIAEYKAHGVDDIVAARNPVFYKVDKFTIVRRSFDPDTMNWYTPGWYWIWPHEIWETYGDLSDWRHQCGTGPWMLTDMVPESSITYERNPNYWQSDPLHPENKLPYIDRVRVLCIDDESTFLAAVKTHKIDRAVLPWDKTATIRETNPELLSQIILPSRAQSIYIRTDIPPFSDKQVRQACMLAINQPEMLEDYYKGNAVFFMYPMSPAYSAFIPLEELDAFSQSLYEYHPDEARKLLADAGYPNGFDTKLYVYPEPARIDACLMVQEYLADIGINVELETPEATTFTSILNSREYQHMIHGFAPMTRPLDAIQVCHDGWRPGGVPAASPWNYSRVADDISYETCNRIYAAANQEEKDKILGEQTRRVVPLCYELALPTPSNFFVWAPWVKRFGGEVGWLHASHNSQVRYWWIDQDLKYEITGQQ